MRDILLFLVVVASIPCVAQTDEEYTIDSCPDTTKACVIAYHSNDGTEFNGRTSYSYYDHFGRLEEVLDLGITPNGRDLVALTEYDGFGRQKRQWLQAISLMPDHKYVEENIVRAMSCLTNGNNVPYTRTEYEETPLARPLRVTGAGAAWHSAGKGVNSSYLTNNQTDDSLICWKYVATQNTTNSMTVNCTGKYPAGTLQVVRKEDEDGHTVFEFHDRQEHVVLSRVLLQESNSTTYLDTYYIYDGFGLLRCVLPPKAVLAGVGTVDTSVLGTYAYLYTYDNRYRLVGKKLPGADWIKYVYDIDSRLQFTQDGNQRQNNQWTFYLQDVFGREVMTGTYYGNHPYVTNFNIFIIRNPEDETGYDIPISFEEYKIHTINYYDDYDFLNLLPGIDEDNLSYCVQEDYSITGYTPVGRLTGKRVYHLDGTDSFDTYSFYYDNRYRLIQSHSTNSLGGYDHDYFQLSFTGNPLKHKHVHTASNQNTITEEYTYTYDHADRLLTTTHSLNGGTPVVLAAREYDMLGRLKNIKPLNSDALKTQYTYNVRSWPKTIASPLFSETLSYEDGTTPCWNGNISSLTWNADSVLRRYDYQYDGLSRLTQADYQETGGQNAGRFSTSYAYDLHGNMTGISRQGFINEMPLNNMMYYGTLDNLTLNYNGNQLTSVSNSRPLGIHYNFVNGANSSEEYSYDANGNLSKDLNKGITTIAYNALNLPDSIIFNSGAKIHYLYGADGVKRQVQYYTPNASIVGPSFPMGGIGGQGQANALPVPGTPVPQGTTKTFSYCGNLIYEGNTLTTLLFDGGYVSFAKTGSGANATYTPTYHFYMKDHLGSNRVVASAAGVAEQVNHYYPYGSTFYGESSADHRFKYCGKELDKMHGLDWYDSSARYYDHVLGRFHQIDPLAEKYYAWSPYAYCMGNPVKLVDPWGKEPGDFFFSILDAAIDFGNYYNDNSIREGKEYGSSIFIIRNKNGEYGFTYSVPNIGNKDGVRVSLAPIGAQTIATIHSHGNYNEEYYNNEFSGLRDRKGQLVKEYGKIEDMDIGNANNRKMDSFVVTPNGSLQHYSFATKRISQVSNDMPSDPKDPDRKNSNSSYIERNPAQVNDMLRLRLKVLNTSYLWKKD